MSDVFRETQQAATAAAVRDAEVDYALQAGAPIPARIGYRAGYGDGVEAAAKLLGMMPAGTPLKDAARAIRDALGR